MTQLFCIPAEIATKFTRSQREWVKTKCTTYRTYGAVDIDLEQMNIDELYNLDRILAWVHRKEEEQHAEPASEK